MKYAWRVVVACPMVFAAQPGAELADVVVSCGMVVEPENPQAMADAVARLAADPEARAAFGAAGRCYAEQYLGREVVLQRFEAQLEALCRERIV